MGIRPRFRVARRRRLMRWKHSWGVYAGSSGERKRHSDTAHSSRACSVTFWEDPVSPPGAPQGPLVSPLTVTTKTATPSPAQEV